MMQRQQGSVLRIISPFDFLLRERSTESTIRLELTPVANRGYYHLLHELENNGVEFVLRKAQQDIRDEVRKGIIYLKGEDITSLYRKEVLCPFMDEELPRERMLGCFVTKVECLRLELVVLELGKLVTFYFSELKLLRIADLHPKQAWEQAQAYFKRELEGGFVRLQVGGSEKYKEQVNIYGEIVDRDGHSVKEKFIEDGYVEVAKDAGKYLSQEEISELRLLEESAKKTKGGMWQEKKGIKATDEFMYRQWEEWLKQSSLPVPDSRREEELKCVADELCRQSGLSKTQHSKVKIAIDVLMRLLETVSLRKCLRVLEQTVKAVCHILVQCQITVYHNASNLDYLKFLCRLLVFLMFSLDKMERLANEEAGDNAKRVGLCFNNLQKEVDKVVKFVFKTCFLGNETFHDKLFGRRKECDYENFSFEAAGLDEGCSSYSEYSGCSDMEDRDRSESRADKKQKKLVVAQQKIRFNSVSLLSHVFKQYPSLVETHWELCVTPNILTAEFLAYLRKLTLSSGSSKLNAEEKQEIVTLMRTNFGDHSLILLAVFERSSKVKLQAVECLLNMLANFQGKKLIDTTESTYIEKLLKSTRSSFVPKSFIIFSGLRNALYFLLFSLHYEKNVQVVVSVFTALAELCRNSTLIEKMPFEEGVGLLMANYISPVLDLDWQLPQLTQLKTLCISFLAILVSTGKRWQQLEQLYLTGQQGNINAKLLQVLTDRNKHRLHGDKIAAEIINYFGKLPKKYFQAVFYKCLGEHSVWSCLCSIYEQVVDVAFTAFVEEVFKCHFDQLRLKEDQLRLKEEQQGGVSCEQLGLFLQGFLKVYTRQVFVDNYVHLLDILTYVDYDNWGKPEFQVAKNFLMHCFDSLFLQPATNTDSLSSQLIPQDSQFASLLPIKGNSLVRLSLMKLLGYMSFCKQFQKKELIHKCVRLLLQFSKQYKSLNSIVKISWGLSNWARIDGFGDSLSEQQLQECLAYMIKHCESEKEKIASNCTRGLGFFVGNLAGREHSVDLQACLASVMRNLQHPVLKVRTNSTRTLLGMREQLQPAQISELVAVLQVNLLKSNYHLQSETLQLLRQLGNPIPQSRLRGLFVAILRNLMSHTTMEYQFYEIKAIVDLRKTVLKELFAKGELIAEVAKAILPSVLEFLKDCQVQSRHVEAKLAEREFERSDEAKQLVFNIQKGENCSYDEERMIVTEIGKKGVVFEVNTADLELIGKIREQGETWQAADAEWGKISSIRIERNSVWMEQCSVPAELRGVEAELE